MLANLAPSPMPCSNSYSRIGLLMLFCWMNISWDSCSATICSVLLFGLRLCALNCFFSHIRWKHVTYFGAITHAFWAGHGGRALHWSVSSHCLCSQSVYRDYFMGDSTRVCSGFGFWDSHETMIQCLSHDDYDLCTIVIPGHHSFFRVIWMYNIWFKARLQV